jgi:predicted DNA-binding transcriptional regulator YafY
VDRTERFYRIRRRLLEKGTLTRREIEDELEISHATFKRDIEYLRDRLNVPIVWSRECQAYRLDPGAGLSELPGVWFSPAEIYALLEIEHLLGSLGSGLVGRQFEPLRARLAALLERGDRGHREIRRRIRVLALGTRRVDRDVFEALSLALLSRKRVLIRHQRRGDGSVSERVVSPLRLVHYRYNWYLDAWCHLRKDLRVFAVDAIRDARVREVPAREVADDELDRVLGAGYGIFAGAETQTAVLRFTPAAGQMADW